MPTNDDESITAADASVTAVDKRDHRAACDTMLVFQPVDGIFTVTVEKDGTFGKAYAVSDTEGVLACSCPDFAYRQPAGGCKHIRRVAFRTGRREIPSGIPADEIDPHLRLACERKVPVPR